MANNVSFLRGTQAGFDGLTSYTPGAFYLTTDTNRLYYANESNKAKYLNKYVYTVGSASDLTTAIENKDVTDGDFVYVSGSNALVAIKSDTTNGWVQINSYKNNNDNTKVTGLTFAKAVDDTGDSINITYTLKQTTKHQTGADTTEPNITGTFSIAGADIAKIVPKTAVNVGATVVSNKATVKTSGTGSSGTGFTIAGAGSVTVGGSENAITITGKDTTYDLTSPAGEAKVHLVGSNNSNDAVTFKAGTQMSVTGADAGTIDIAHATVETTPSTSEETAVASGKVTVIDGITTTNGHVTGYNTKTITMPKAPEYTITGISGNNQGKVSVTLKEASGAAKTTTSGQDFYYTVNGTKVFNQGSIEFYTKAQIDNKLNGVNAMVYKGTVGGTDGLANLPALTDSPKPVIHVGDTYKVSKKGTYGGHACDVGDLLIAVGTETNGAISADLAWTYVPSGDDTDTQFALQVANNAIKLRNTTANRDAGIATIDAGTNIAVSTSGSTITVAHEGITTTPTNVTATALAAKGTFQALTAVTASNGHITGYTNTTYTLPPDNNTTYSISATAGESNKANISLKGSNNSTDSIILAAGTDLTATTASDTVTINHKSYGTPSHTGATGALVSGGTFVALTAITTSNGHVTGYTPTTYTLPTAPKYTLGGTTVTGVTNGVQVVNTLSGSGGANGQSSTSTLDITSTSLKITAGTKSCAINIEWGSF